MPARFRKHRACLRRHYADLRLPGARGGHRRAVRRRWEAIAGRLAQADQRGPRRRLHGPRGCDHGHDGDHCLAPRRCVRGRGRGHAEAGAGLCSGCPARRRTARATSACRHDRTRRLTSGNSVIGAHWLLEARARQPGIRIRLRLHGDRIVGFDCREVRRPRDDGGAGPRVAACRAARRR